SARSCEALTIGCTSWRSIFRRFELFNHNIQADIINTKRTADEILAGIDNGEFTAWYQPQFSARTMEMTGVEALVRWNHPSKGLLTPD
ncbi:EAL domain-containing protein, partial [Rhizobium ruizarguesonis]